ncbi:peroxidase 66 [Cucurbita pepo subsp. pepo]|uniref:peroxidase 66 n=1 Tax=Cucurbita pepo subsp. pepo TaxID=3664 RepID=UPI000C9D7907|nr:peroxidase 66 [Cucurbita pepo subsp. pepo]
MAKNATVLFLMMIVCVSEAVLHTNYYSKTCPNAEKIILQTVYNASIHDPKVPARLLRLFFHDCFIRGCDASVLIDSTPGNQAEKDAPPNISLRSFYVIDEAKSKLETACPHSVSCADIVAIAARDVVTLSGGPYWSVLKGRKDGKISNASETINLPAPTFNVSQLIQSFENRGLQVKDLVALSGAHTLGFSHCSSFQSRLRNFSTIHDTDPTLESGFAQILKNKCPKPNLDKNAGQFLDPTSSTFDNVYYKRLLEGKGVFGSDQSLFGDSRTKTIVESFANEQNLFFKEFAASMVKLGNVGVIENGNVRFNCRVVN